MKKFVAVMLAMMLCATSALAQEAEETTTPMLDQMGRGTGRGFVNMLTGWMELPRNLWVETSRNPYFGFFTGVSDGSWLTVLRTLGGTTDFVTMGLTGDGFHGSTFPFYVWDAPWHATDPMINQ